MTFEGLRKRVKNTPAKQQGRGYCRETRHFYSEPDDPCNQWVDDDGLHIAVPGRISETGRRFGLPYTEIIDDIA